MLDLSHVNALITPLPPIATPGKQAARRTAPVGASPQRTPHTPLSAGDASMASAPAQGSPGSIGPSPRARRVGYTVDLASQKLYMASLNKNRFRASLSFQDFEAGLQEALQEHAQMAEVKFQAMKAEQDEKNRQLELALARLARAEETISMLTDRVSESETAHADLAVSAQSQVGLYAQQAGEMAGMVNRLRERLKADTGASTGGAGAGDADGAGTGGGAAAGGALEQQLQQHQAAERESAARVMRTAGKLDQIAALVGSLTAKFGDKAGEMTPRASSAAVGELAKKIDALSHSSLLKGRGVATPIDGKRPRNDTVAPQQRLEAASGRLADLATLVAQLKDAVRQEESAFSAPPALPRVLPIVGSVHLLCPSITFMRALSCAHAHIPPLVQIARNAPGSDSSYGACVYVCLCLCLCLRI